jgi:hypothetical protein
MAFTTPGTAVAGEVLTAAFWNEQVRDNTDALYQSTRRLAYQTRTSTISSITATTFATGTSIFDTPATFTADGTSSYLVEFHVALCIHAGGANQISLVLADSTTAVGVLALPCSTGGGGDGVPVFCRFYWTPAAGSRSLNVRCFVNANEAQLYMGTGTGGASSYTPGYLAVYGPLIA